jgi:type I restriction-modification system DNA methylase subunit
MNKDQFLALLPTLGFAQRGGLLVKDLGSARLVVDVAHETLRYPDDLKVNDETTCNFEHEENFVVFECVHRLLEKGYASRHLELEPRWQLGRGASGGKADILVRDNADKALLIIECKTHGREFTRAWNDTCHDGGQLFGYLEQERATQFLCLYTSWIKADAARYTAHLITHRDNTDYLRDNPCLAAFASAQNREARFAVWRDTYKLDFRTVGLFEEGIAAYHIGKDKYSLRDLHPISAEDQQKKYHEFATILRQHNVSGRENAFDKLINLLLCKIVDETEHPDELWFYWKGVAYDTHFGLLDRLQQLYSKGMGKFLNEEITYIAKEDVAAALRFVRHNPDATERAVWNLFIQQKFFTNNDFSLIDVHNERLFYQNAGVLLKILQMWQDIRLTGNGGHNQFLGDLFEGFLDQGIKQTEGQFFTPIPICRFMFQSLPLEALVQGEAEAPKAIDFACGAGHFLTEFALQLRPLVEQHHHGKEMGDYHAAIVGVEKEYRLSKVAKVSAFMYGQPEIRICYGDGLVSSHASHPEIADGTFDVLFANPPFSVEGFLETLPVEERMRFSMTHLIKDADTSSVIETFFVERAAQLLKAGGLAAVILPTSILSNGAGAYVRAREILLQSFDIVALVELGNGTFGATGTITVIAFLRRKATGPDTATHYRERIEEWFRGPQNDRRKQVAYKDAHLLERYAAHRAIPWEDYRTFLCGQPSGALLAHEYFAACREIWENSSATKALKAKVWFRALDADAGAAELAKRFHAWAVALEKDKLLHFVLADTQPSPVVIVRAPTETKAEKRFLGYDWSRKRGKEGIKLIKDTDNQHLTPLYDPRTRDNPAKVNSLIAQNFAGTLAAVPADLATYASIAPLVDLLDFERADFDKQISLKPTKQQLPKSKWPYEPLGVMADLVKGITYAGGDEVPHETNNVILTADNITLAGDLVISKKVFLREEFVPDQVARLRKDDLFICFSSGSRNHVGKVCRIAADLPYFAGGFMGILRGKDGISAGYLFELLNSPSVRARVRAASLGANIHNLSSAIGYLKLPRASPAIQETIVAECAAVDFEVAAARVEIEKAEAAIRAVIPNSGVPRTVASLLKDLEGFTTKIAEDAINETGTIPVVTQAQDNLIAGYCEHSEPIADVPLIVFGDHTCAFKLVEFPFVRGADGTQLLKVDPTEVLPKFLFHLLRHTEIPNSGKYERHFKYLKALRIPIPSPTEQARVVAVIETHEAAIAEAQNILAAAATRKEAILMRFL